MSKLELIANRVFPDGTVTDLATLPEKYKPRNLTPDQMVTRIAPSPTGFVHIGTIYMGLINYLLAHQSGGKFILRIEDTDQKREIENGAKMIVDAFKTFGMTFDEGPLMDGKDKGEYGPYIQSDRQKLYHAHAKDLISKGKAYLCFCSAEELDKTRELQTATKQRTGYYGKYARCRNLSEDAVLENLDQGKPFVLRIKSNGHHEKHMDVKDIARGTRSLPQNDIDIVIMKSDDGLPTYHFAHIIDDHHMQTTHVIRADEWFPSLPLHLELFQIMGWTPPKYAHLSPIQKMDGDTTRRKLSKSKDPETNIAFFIEKGYPVNAIIEYLLNLVNSDFEDWRMKNPAASVMDFKIDLKKTSPSGALFDNDKLDSISRRIISEYTKDEVYSHVLVWAQAHDADFHARLVANEDYLKKIFNIERETARKRKDITRWGMVKADIAYFFDDLYTKPDLTTLNLAPDVITAAIRSYLDTLNAADTRDQWWDKAKAAAEANRFATDMKKYKENKSAFNGSIADYMKIIRLALTGKEDSPDIYEITQVLGLDKTKARLTALTA